MTLNSRDATLTEIKKFYGTYQKNLNKDKPILSAAKYTATILESGPKNDTPVLTLRQLP